MIEKHITKTIMSDVKKLSLVQQKRLHDFALAMLMSESRGTAGSDLVKFSGTIDSTSIREMREAIQDGCERVDRDDW